MVEHNNSSRYNDNKGKRKHHDTRANPNKKQKVTCWKCGKPRHVKKDCKAGNVSNIANGSNIKGSKDGSFNPLKGQSMFNKSHQIYYVTYVSEAFFVQDDDVAWWVESGATVHVCKDRCWFKTYESLNDGSIIHMGNESTALVHGRGCVDLRAAVRLSDPKLKTLGERGIECIFVRYVKHSKAFRFYVIKPNDSVAINSIIESNDAIFDEHMFSSVLGPSQRSLQSEPELRKNKRHRTPKDFGPEFQLYLIEGTRDEVFDQHSYWFNVEDDPINEAMKSQDVAFWKEAINDEIDSIIGNNTWVLTDLPPGCRPLGYKWIFKRKLKVDGTVEKFKEGLVIQGFKQKSRIDYFDTYALVARISTIRLLFAMTSIHSLIIHQMDVKTTFLNRDLEEKVDLTKEFLSVRFSMKDMGEADVILGIRIKHESNATLKIISLQVVGYSCLVVVQFLRLLKSKLVSLIPLWVKPIAPIFIRCDSATTLAKAYSQMCNGKSRHLGVGHSMIRELITNVVVSIEFVRSQQNIAGHLTKGMARDLVIKSAEWMRLKSN
nr:zinc finger, CCHC-type [Tanacetum cinerariifolium]